VLAAEHEDAPTERGAPRTHSGHVDAIVPEGGFTIRPKDIIELSDIARLKVTPDEEVRAEAARELGFWFEYYASTSMLRAKRARRGDPQKWAGLLATALGEVIHLLGGDANAQMPFDGMLGNKAAGNLARALPGVDQPDRLRMLRDLQANAGVVVGSRGAAHRAGPRRARSRLQRDDASAASTRDYDALVVTVRHTVHGAAAVRLLAERLEQSDVPASMSEGALRRRLFHHLGRIFEQLHPGRRFTVSSQRSQPSGPAYRGSLALLQLAARRLGNAFPELAKLNRWAETHPGGVAMLIREVRQHGGETTN
jgi:hypothetical protein